MAKGPGGRLGKCYGSTTVSERGQIVIPAEARQELGLEPGTKLLVFGPLGPLEEGGLTLITASTVTKFLRHFMSRLSEFEEIIQEEISEEENQ